MKNKILKLFIILAVFANDPLKEYFKKGELVDRYFNPCDFFDEVHFISLVDKEIEVDKIKHTVGRAKAEIHTVTNIGLWVFNPFSSGRERILELAKEINPDCVRGYNMHVHGYLGACTSKRLGLPFVISLHTNPEKDIRAFLGFFAEPQKWLFWRLCKYFIEPFVAKSADRIICVYSFIYSFAKSICADEGKLKLIYNRIDMDRFKPINRSNAEVKRIRILNVGRIFERKNPENLVKAMKEVDAELLIIGDGPLKQRIEKLVTDLKLQSKVSLIPAVSNIEIHRYYQDSDIFVAVTEYGETSKVMIEAMASALPVVVNAGRYGAPEFLEDTAVIAENSKEGFVKAINYLISNHETRQLLGSRNRQRIMQIEGKIMENNEAQVYRELISKSI